MINHDKRKDPSPIELQELNKSLMKLMDLNIIKYRIVDAHDIGVQYNDEYVDFVSRNKDMLQLKTMESIVSATLAGYPLSHDETKLAAHTTNIIMYLVMTGRQDKLPNVKGIVPLAYAIAAVEEMVTEQILMDDEKLEKQRKEFDN